MEPEEVNPETLARYLAGAASEAEAERVRAWLEIHPEARIRLEGAPGSRRDPQEALAKLAARIREQAPPDPAPQRIPHRQADRLPAARPSFPARRLRRAGAVFAFVLAAAAGLLLYRQPGTGLNALTTAAGQREVVTLEDGTRVELSAASTLFFPDTFDADRRDVRLEGEAFFDVAADAARPFVISTDEGVVQVLGTAFGVRDHAEAGELAVTVVEGRVSLRTNGAPEAAAVTLRPGQQGFLTRHPGDEGYRVAVHRVDPEAYLAWREGEIRFVGTPLWDVALALERWYGIEVTADPSLESMRLDAAFHGEPLEQVLETISLTLGISYSRTERQVSFSSAQNED